MVTVTNVHTVFHWLGQACFLILTLAGARVGGHALQGSRILIDPPAPMVGYKIAAHSIPADIVLVSHHHPDHDYVQAAFGSPKIVEPLISAEEDSADTTDSTRGSGDYQYKRIFADHDSVHGAKRGHDTITVLETGGLRVCHLGDLGQLALTSDQLKAIGRVDVLMIPVGGFFTIDGPQAAAIVGQLHPRVILPMHYATPALNPDLRSKLAPPDAFLAAMRGKAKIVRVKARDLTLSPETLPKTPTIYLLRYQ